MQLFYRGRGYKAQPKTVKISPTHSDLLEHSSLEKSSSVVIPPVVVLRYRGAAYLKF